MAGSRWLVPSQSNASGGYVVDADAQTCSCPDHEDRGVKCKHIWAVAYIRQELSLPDGTTVTTEARITYRQDWPAYNAAQCDEGVRVQLLLRGLCDGIVQPPQTSGRPRLPLADVVYSATMQVFGGMSGRRSTSDVRALAERGLVRKAPSYNSVFRYLEGPAMAPLLKTLVHESAAPLRAIETAFATDSTGFATNTYARYFDAKYNGEKKCQRWVKLHAQIGTVTNVIASVEATESGVGDVTMLAPLLASSVVRGFNVRELSADKAYLSNDNLTAIEAAGAVPYIPFKSNSRGTGKSDAWRRLWHMFEARNDEFLAHYHRRSNAESTFSMMKRKFGPSVRAKTPAAQASEVLLKCLCHNLSVLVHAIHELGIEPTFWSRMEAA
ncbi:MAG TPA: transposase [Kofleriaceae bacterium]|nr:transposase [Kofleriaceae bacterium]